MGILGSPGSAVEAHKHGRCCEQAPGWSFSLLISSVSAPAGSYTGHSSTVTPTDQTDLRTWGLRGQEIEQAGDLGCGLGRARCSRLREPGPGGP